MAQTPVARALDKLFDEKKPDGTPRFSIVEIHAMRSMILIEIARRGEIDQLSDERKKELAFLFELIGLTPQTNPDLAYGMVQKYFKNLDLSPDLFVEMDRIFKMYASKGDRLEAIEKAEKAYDKLTDKDAPAAPQVGEKPPENT